MSVRGDDGRLLAEFGISEVAEQVWHVLVSSPQLDLDGLAVTAELDRDTVISALGELVAHELAHPAEAPSGFLAYEPTLAVQARIAREQREMADRAHRLTALQARLTTVSEKYAIGATLLRGERRFDVLDSFEEVEQHFYMAADRTCRDIRTMCHRVTAQGVRQPLEKDIPLYERGIRFRTLVATDQLVDEDIYSAFFEIYKAGDDVRCRSDLPTSMIIWDGFAAALPLDQADKGRGAMFVHDPTIIDILIRVFDHYWHEATQLFEPESGPPGADRRSAVLKLLAAGATDAAIARSLGVGMRTVRRDVSDLRAQLGVNSRTEVVAAAIRRGWL